MHQPLNPGLLSFLCGHQAGNGVCVTVMFINVLMAILSHVVHVAKDPSSMFSCCFSGPFTHEINLQKLSCKVSGDVNACPNSQLPAAP